MKSMHQELLFQIEYYTGWPVYSLLSKSKLNKVDIKSLKIEFKKTIMLNKTYNFLIENNDGKYILKFLKAPLFIQK